MDGRDFFINREEFDYSKEGDINSSFSNNYEDFENQYNTFYEGLFEEGEEFIPSSIFSSKLGSLQAIVKYLKDHRGKKFSEIALMLSRDQRTIWHTYKQSEGKKIKVLDSERIPLSILKNRNQSVLENIIIHLKNSGKSFNEISVILKRNYQTIYTTYRKARRKSNE